MTFDYDGSGGFTRDSLGGGLRFNPDPGPIRSERAVISTSPLVWRCGAAVAGSSPQDPAASMRVLWQNLLLLHHSDIGGWWV